jgi:hypothetical protein
LSETKEIRKLTEAEWAEIVAEWELGTTTLAELEKRFGISQPALSMGLKKRGAVRGSKAETIRKRVSEALVESAVEKARSFSEAKRGRIEETKEQQYQWAVALAKATMNIVAKSARDRTPIAANLNDLKALRVATAVISTVRQERYRLLDMDEAVDDNEIPELHIKEFTPDELQKIHSSIDSVLDLPAPAEIPDLDLVVEDAPEEASEEGSSDPEADDVGR